MGTVLLLTMTTICQKSNEEEYYYVRDSVIICMYNPIIYNYTII